MTRRERDEVMRYAGQLQGIASMLIPDECEDEEDDYCTIILINKLMDLASDLEFLAKGTDRLNIPKNIVPLKGGDGDDV